MTKRNGYVEISSDLLESLAFDQRLTIERDPEAERLYLKTDSGWYTSQLGGDAA